MFEIRIEEGGRELLRKSLADGSYYLGRSKDNELSISNSSVSRKHLRIDVSPREVRVTDLGSTNGTKLDGSRLAPNQAATWSDHEIIEIGSLAISLKSHQENQVIQ